MEGKWAWGCAAIAVACGLWGGMALSTRQAEPSLGHLGEPGETAPAGALRPRSSSPQFGLPWFSTLAQESEPDANASAIIRAKTSAPAKSSTVITFTDHVDERALEPWERARLLHLRAQFHQAALAHSAAPGCVKPEDSMSPTSEESLAPSIRGWDFSGVSLDLEAPGCSLDQKRLALAALANQPGLDLVSESKAWIARESIDASIYQELWRQGLAAGPEGQATIDALVLDRRARLGAERELLLQRISTLPTAPSDLIVDENQNAYETRLTYLHVVAYLDAALAPGAIEAQVKSKWAEWAKAQRPNPAG